MVFNLKARADVAGAENFIKDKSIFRKVIRNRFV